MGALEPLEGHPYDELSTAHVGRFPSFVQTSSTTVQYCREHNRFPVLAMDLFSAHGPHDKGVS
jgi:hypothetical protein